MRGILKSLGSAAMSSPTAPPQRPPAYKWKSHIPRISPLALRGNQFDITYRLQAQITPLVAPLMILRGLAAKKKGIMKLRRPVNMKERPEIK